MKILIDFIWMQEGLIVMVNSFLWVLVDVIFMIGNYIEYKKSNKWYNYFFVIVFFMLAMLTIMKYNVL